jgi:hypothetical protein
VRTLIFAALTTLLFGCMLPGQAPVEAPKIVVKQLVDAPPAVTTAPDAILVLDGMNDLPRGFFYYSDREGGAPRYKLYAVPGYPTADTAHVVIAGMATERPGMGYGRQREALLAEYRRHASELGANALFVPGDSSGVVFALRVGAGAPPSVDTAADALIRGHVKELKGYRAAGAPAKVDLTAAEWQITTKEARCYAAVIALEPGATLGDLAQSTLYLELESNDGLLGNRSYGGPTEMIANPDGLPIEAPRHGKFIAMRSHAAELGCAKGSARATLRLWTRGKVINIGTGALRVALLDRTISKKELAEKVKASDAAWEQARLDAERQRQEDQRREAERDRERERERAQREAARNQGPPPGGGGGGASSAFSMSLKNECPRTVRMFIGTKPKFGSGTTTTVSSNSISSYSGTAPQMYWIVDEHDNGLSSYTASPGRQNVRILPSCTGFAPN